MQLTATPPPTPVAAATPPAPAPTSSPLGQLTAILRGTPPAEAAPPATAPAAPVQEASTGQQLLGKVGTAQNRYLANQQLLGAISHALTERISYIGSQAWAILRGTASTGG